MRKSRAETAKTRERIVAAASAEFRRQGIEATGLVDLMKAAGLTHGGFYKHFESKDQLVAEACTAALLPSEDATFWPPESAARKKGRAGLKARASAYLSAGHRDNPQAGCPFAALGSELARADDETRSMLTAGLQRGIELFAEHFDNVRPEEATRRAIVMASLMAGALTLARVVDDAKLSNSIMSAAVESVVRLYDEQ